MVNNVIYDDGQKLESDFELTNTKEVKSQRVIWRSVAGRICANYSPGWDFIFEMKVLVQLNLCRPIFFSS